MKINFEKLREIEKNYNESYISQDTLRQMVDLVLKDTGDHSFTFGNTNIAYETLKSLGILEVGESPRLNPEKPQNPQLLKS